MRIIKDILQMKKAFSLFEFILTLLVFSVLCTLFVYPFMNFYKQSFQSTQQTQTQINAYSSLILIDKILQDCLEFQSQRQGFSCLLESKDELILQRQKSLYIGSSSILLEQNNSTFYAPKSHFIYTYKLITEDKTGLKENFIKAGVVQDHLNLYKHDELYFYALKEKQIFTLKALDEQNLAFTQNSYFTGFYKLIGTRVSLVLENENLLLQYLDIHSNKVLSSTLLLNEVKSFSTQEQNKAYTSKLCLKQSPICLEKWSFK